MELPNRIIEQGFEDTESIDNNIDSLYQTFIVPIDKIRSIAEAPPGKFQNNQKQTGIVELKVNPISALESRISAFYRFLGLPIVAGSSFYNAGWNPNPKGNIDRDSINSKIDATSLNLFTLREQHAKSFDQLFISQSFDATLFGLGQRFIKPFNMLDVTTGTKVVDGRSNIIQQLKTLLPNLSSEIDQAQASFSSRMGFSINSVRHILKPFAVDPAIDFTIMPINNKICVPFLPDLTSTRVSASPEIFLLRPGIEFIIRARLQDTAPDPVFLQTAQNIINGNAKPNTTNTVALNDLTNTLTALADNNNITDPTVLSTFSAFTSTQAETTQQLIKTIRVAIDALHQAVSDLDAIQEKITFLPIPNKQGFEKGGTLQDSQPTTKLEVNLVTLTIKRLNAQQDLGITRSLGNFATSGFINLEKTDLYTQQIDELTQTKNEIGSRGISALKTIEIVTGESSGLGLIDILAIYTALWAINIDELLAFLDLDAINRLVKFFPNLVTTEVNNQKNGSGTDIVTATTALEHKIENILSFADLMFARTLDTPNQEEGGLPA